MSGLRAFKQATFEFKPGMNLLVGINGVGKTTVLDALRICLSKILTETSASKNPSQGFDQSDIRIGLNAMQVSCNFQIKANLFNLLINKQKDEFSSNEGGLQRELKKKKRSREMREAKLEKEIQDSKSASLVTPNYEKIEPSILTSLPDIKASKEQTLAIYFSTRRSLVVEQKGSSTISAGGQAAAFAESLSINRPFNLREMAEWFRTREVLAEESPMALRHIDVLRSAVDQFLPEFNNLHVLEARTGLSFYIDKDGIPLNIAQLSDGERGVLSVVLDLSKRLSQANPELDDPNKNGVAIVLIDELDLHLHPKWQRTIVENLTRTFPNCQFIVTTHSPQIIPSVDPGRVLIIKDNSVIRPDRSYGMDSNWILRILMESDDRPTGSAEAIHKVEELINKGRFTAALKAMDKYLNEGWDIPEWAILRTRIARFEAH